jgi:DNA-binding NarL/FixJ family response regulator
MTVLRVAVVDDQELVRAGFVSLLSATPDLQVVGEASQGEEAVRMVRATHPDVVLMDVRMPVMDGIEATRRIMADPSCGATRVVVLTTFGLDEYVFGALRAGAVGFLLKDTPPDELLRAVRVAADGDALLSPPVTRRLIEVFAATPPPVVVRRLPDLTDREVDVLVLVAQGLSNAEIAHRLHIGSATVKTYVSRLLTKLEVSARIHLAIHAYESGLLVPNDKDPSTGPR